MLYDVTGEVSVAQLLAEEYPDVDFIIPHLGSFADDWSAQIAFVGHLVNHPNIYTDTAGVRRFDVCSTPFTGPARPRSCSDPTAPGCIPASSWPRCSSSGCHRRLSP